MKHETRQKLKNNPRMYLISKINKDTSTSLFPSLGPSYKYINKQTNQATTGVRTGSIYWGKCFIHGFGRTLGGGA